MTTSTIEFTVILDILDATMKGVQESRKLLAGDTEIVYGGEKMPLSDALADWLLQALPQEVATIAATVQVRPSPLDDASGGGLGGGGQVGTTGKSLASTPRKAPRKVTRSGSAKPAASAK